MNECTTIDTPFCLYDANRNKDTKSFKGPGVLVCSIDNMPTQLPKESTDFFGDLLYPYALDIIRSDARKPLEEHNFDPAVRGAIIASNGKLTSNFEYIHELRQLNQRSKHKADNRELQNKTVKYSFLLIRYITISTFFQLRILDISKYREGSVFLKANLI
jgi:alpha-aminoadipic semialdehyde synthase